MDSRTIIAKNVATLIKPGDLVNLGIGIPTLVPKFIPKDQMIMFHGENGSIGCDEVVSKDDPRYDPNIVDATGDHALFGPGGAVMDSAQSFALVRSGRLSMTVLGAMQVDQEGSLASWSIPGKKLSGPGGAMDIVVGARQVVIASEHCTKKGEPKILKRCTLPLTAKGVCDYIVTELAIIKVVDEGLKLIAKNPEVTVENIIAKTDADLIIPEHIDDMVI